MDMSLQGRCAEAVAFFRLIMEQEPDLFAPRFQFAACQRVLGENAEAETLLDELVAQLRAQGANRDLAQVLMTRGVLYNRTGRLDLAKADHEAALAILEHFEDPELRARVLQNLSIVEEDQGNFDRAEELLDLAVLAYQEAGRETLPGHLYSGRANLQMDRGELVTARDYLEQALRAFREAGDRRNEAMMLNNTGYLLREMGKLEEAEGYHLRSLEMREAIGDQVGVGRVYGQLAALYTAQGRHREAADAGRSALAIAQERGDRLYEGTALAQIAAAESASGNNAEARSTYEDSRAVFTDIGDQMRVLQVDLELARLDVGEGRLDAAEHTGLRVAEAAAALSLVQPEVEALQLQGEVAAARGDVPAAVVAFRRALDRVREASWDGKQAEITVQLIHAYLDTDDTRAAAPLVGALQGFPASVVSLRAGPASPGPMANRNRPVA